MIGSRSPKSRIGCWDRAGTFELEAVGTRSTEGLREACTSVAQYKAKIACDEALMKVANRRE